MVAVTGSCAAFYFGVDVSKWLSPTRVCVTRGCVQLANRLAASIDAAVNPCDDFYRFACGGIAGTVANSTSSASHSVSTFAAGGHQDDVLSRVHTILANWALEDTIQTPLQTSASLYQGCVGVFSGQKKGVRLLLRFLQKCRLNFAKEEDLDTDPLDSALNLDMRYNVKTVFDVAAEGIHLLVRRRRALETWSSQRQALIKKHTYSDYLENTFALLGFPTRMRITFMAASVWEAEDTVMRLFARIKPDDKALVKFDYVEPGTVMERPEWKRHLSRFWERVAVKGTSMATFLKHVFAELTPLAITQYIFWEVVRQLGPLADYRLSVPDETAQVAEGRCLRIVYDVAGLAPLAVVLAQEVSTETVLSATSFVTRLVRNVGATNVTVRVVDPRHLLQGRTSSTPAAGRRNTDPAAADDLLPEGSHNDDADAFLDSFLRALLELRERELDSLDALEAVPTTEDLLASRVTVDAANRRVMVPASMLVQPWFSADVPRSFNYAGLGFAVVRELISAGIRLKARFLITSTTSGRYCNHTARGAEGRALEAILRVLSQSGRERHKLKLPGLLDSMSEEQLFFLAYCTGGCRGIESGYNATGECNDVLRSTLHFGSSFECVRGVQMYPMDLERCAAAKPSVKSRLKLMFSGPFWQNVARKVANISPRNWTVLQRRH
ncbi:hypothetical protein HPB50_015854 [Hyalomma asiaticum]|uniref:Uncharacterized protein n=1 Tax=Hyalomma asiaticum TaxID=266040 RepID=A0ACB7RWP9_HYAAI|nr:hypothetical protein HPB50_015854 [Hyalomma asiaticum]